MLYAGSSPCSMREIAHALEWETALALEWETALALEWETALVLTKRGNSPSPD